MKDDDIAVSVLMMAYNEESYIEQAIESIISQKTSFRFEVICHDDASQDKTPQIIEKYASLYPDIVIPIIQTSNKTQLGENIMLKYMYPYCRGTYLCYCDGDDYWTDMEKLQRQYDFLEGNKDYNLCLCKFIFYFEDSETYIEALTGEKEKDLNIEDFIRWDVKRIPQVGTAMFRKEIAYNRPAMFRQVGGGKNSLRNISDMPLYIYLSLNGRVKYFPDSVAVWRRRVSGTWSHEAQDLKKNVEFKKQYINFLEQLDNYTNHKYHKQIQKKENTVKTDIAYITQNYKYNKMEIWNSYHKFSKKLFMTAAAKFPRLAEEITKSKLKIKNEEE